MRVLLIIPMFNEASRLNDEEIKKYGPNIDFVFMDDGSSDSTLRVITELSRLVPNSFVFSSRKNIGKGNAISFAFLELQKKCDYTKYDWIGFWDADLSTPLSEVSYMLSLQNGYTDSIWASRKKAEGTDIRRRFIRHVFGRSFNLISSLLLHHSFYDTQCGAKLFRADAAQVAFSKPFLNPWVFDLEIFLRLIGQGKIVTEIPIRKWTHVRGSKISLIKDGPSIFFSLIRLKLRYKV